MNDILHAVVHIKEIQLRDFLLYFKVKEPEILKLSAIFLSHYECMSWKFISLLPYDVMSFFLKVSQALADF